MGLLQESKQTQGGTAKLETVVNALEALAAQSEYLGFVDMPNAQGETLRFFDICSKKSLLTASIQNARLIAERLIDGYGRRAMEAERSDGLDWKALSHAVRIGQEAVTISSPVQADVQDHIRRKLETLAQDNRVKPLFGIESGSRAWGFPSADSDYDVRFVYRCTMDDYLSVTDRRDVIDTPTVHDAVLGTELDLNGWDIRKALQLALKSNAALLEWLNSPVCYIKDEELNGLLQGFANKAANLQVLSYHYGRLAHRAWEEALAGSNQVKLKRYCYAVRSALALAWIGNNQTIPPMGRSRTGTAVKPRDFKSRKTDK